MNARQFDKIESRVEENQRRKNCERDQHSDALPFRMVIILRPADHDQVVVQSDIRENDESGRSKLDELSEQGVDATGVERLAMPPRVDIVKIVRRSSYPGPVWR